MSRPILRIIAGANGAGKSSLSGGNPFAFAKFPLLDPDAIAKTIQPSLGAGSALASGRQVLERIESYLHARQSFAVETTLSGKNYLQLMQRARNLGFEVVLIYIGTENVEINLTRIARRVLLGGHSVPEVDVRRRYIRSFQNLPLATRRANHVILFDNSTEEAYRLIGVTGETAAQWFPPLPPWARDLPSAKTV